MTTALAAVVAAITVAALAEALLRAARPGCWRWWQVGAAVWAALYLAALGGAGLADRALYAHWERFDANGDGWLGGAEITPGAEAALAAVAADTGRQFAPLTGLPASAIAAGLWVAARRAVARGRGR